MVPPTHPPFLVKFHIWLNSSYDSTETRGEPLQNKVLEGRRVFFQTSSLLVAVLHVRDSIREIPNNRSQTRRILSLNISIHILLTLLFTFPLVVTRRFYLWIIALKLAIISFIRMTLMNDSAVLMRVKSDLATPKVLRADYERSAHHRSMVNL